MQKVHFSQKALSDLQRLFVYLDENWPGKVRIDFQNEFLRTMKIIQQNPDAFPQTDIEGIQKAVITKHNSILYTLHKKELRIMRVFDTRLHPKKRKR